MKLRQKVNTQNNWIILQIVLSGRGEVLIREEGEAPFIGEKEGANPTSNQCGIAYLKNNRCHTSYGCG